MPWFRKEELVEVVPAVPPITAEHISLLAQAISESHEVLKQTVLDAARVNDQVATHLFQMAAALRAFEQSHAERREGTVNGFPFVEYIQHNCPLCIAAREALE